ncbi:unnamed protein product [Gulo gulo]|uniref:Uncharacterized protein n=1 Tax=Gulo gulo TaxID=48420 RepID=A0A9X9Q6G6_GULGU|nr:unnamed protein product [Gulo gulo]
MLPDDPSELVAEQLTLGNATCDEQDGGASQGLK